MNVECLLLTCFYLLLCSISHVVLEELEKPHIEVEHKAGQLKILATKKSADITFSNDDLNVQFKPDKIKLPIIEAKHEVNSFIPQNSANDADTRDAVVQNNVTLIDVTDAATTSNATIADDADARIHVANTVVRDNLPNEGVEKLQNVHIERLKNEEENAAKNDEMSTLQSDEPNFQVNKTGNEVINDIKWKGRIDNKSEIDHDSTHVLNTLNEIKDLVKQSIKSSDDTDTVESKHIQRFHSNDNGLKDNDLDNANSVIGDAESRTGQPISRSLDSHPEDMAYVSKAQEILKAYENTDADSNENDNKPGNRHTNRFGQNKESEGSVINESVQLHNDDNDNSTKVENDTEESVTESIDSKDNVVLTDNQNSNKVGVNDVGGNVEENDDEGKNIDNNVHSKIISEKQNSGNNPSAVTNHRMSHRVVDMDKFDIKMLNGDFDPTVKKQPRFTSLEKSENSPNEKSPEKQLISPLKEQHANNTAAENIYASFNEGNDTIESNNPVDSENANEGKAKEVKKVDDIYASIDNTVTFNKTNAELNVMPTDHNNNVAVNASQNTTDKDYIKDVLKPFTTNKTRDDDSVTNEGVKKVTPSTKVSVDERKKEITVDTMKKLKNYILKKCQKSSKTPTECHRTSKEKSREKSEQQMKKFNNAKDLKITTAKQLLHSKEQLDKQKNIVLHYKQYEKQTPNDIDGGKRAHSMIESNSKTESVKNGTPDNKSLKNKTTNVQLGYASETFHVDKNNNDKENLNNNGKMKINGTLLSKLSSKKLSPHLKNKIHTVTSELQKLHDENEVQEEAKHYAHQTGIDINTTVADLEQAKELANEVANELSTNDSPDILINNQSSFSKLDTSDFLNNNTLPQEAVKNVDTSALLHNKTKENDSMTYFNTSIPTKHVRIANNDLKNHENELTQEEIEKFENDTDITSDETKGSAVNTPLLTGSENENKQMDISPLPIVSNPSKPNLNDIDIEPEGIDSFRSENPALFKFRTSNVNHAVKKNNNTVNPSLSENLKHKKNIQILNDNINKFVDQNEMEANENLDEFHEKLGEFATNNVEVNINTGEGPLFTYSKQSDDEFRQEEPNTVKSNETGIIEENRNGKVRKEIKMSELKQHKLQSKKSQQKIFIQQQKLKQKRIQKILEKKKQMVQEKRKEEKQHKEMLEKQQEVDKQKLEEFQHKREAEERKRVAEREKQERKELTEKQQTLEKQRVAKERQQYLQREELEKEKKLKQQNILAKLTSNNNNNINPQHGSLTQYNQIKTFQRPDINMAEIKTLQRPELNKTESPINESPNKAAEDFNSIVTVEQIDDSQQETDPHTSNYVNSFPQNSSAVNLTVTIGNESIPLQQQHVRFIETKNISNSNFTIPYSKMKVNEKQSKKKDKLFDVAPSEVLRANEMLKNLDINSVRTSSPTVASNVDTQEASGGSPLLSPPHPANSDNNYDNASNTSGLITTDNKNSTDNKNVNNFWSSNLENNNVVLTNTNVSHSNSNNSPFEAPINNIIGNDVENKVTDEIQDQITSTSNDVYPKAKNDSVENIEIQSNLEESANKTSNITNLNKQEKVEKYTEKIKNTGSSFLENVKGQWNDFKTNTSSLADHGNTNKTMNVTKSTKPFKLINSKLKNKKIIKNNKNNSKAHTTSPNKLLVDAPIINSKPFLHKENKKSKEDGGFNFLKIEPPSITSDHLDLDKQSDIASFPAEIRKHLNKQYKEPKTLPSLSVKYEKPDFKLSHESIGTTIDGSHVHSIKTGLLTPKKKKKKEKKKKKQLTKGVAKVNSKLPDKNNNAADKTKEINMAKEKEMLKANSTVADKTDKTNVEVEQIANTEQENKNEQQDSETTTQQHTDGTKQGHGLEQQDDALPNLGQKQKKQSTENEKDKGAGKKKQAEIMSSAVDTNQQTEGTNTGEKQQSTDTVNQQNQVVFSEQKIPTKEQQESNEHQNQIKQENNQEPSESNQHERYSKENEKQVTETEVDKESLEKEKVQELAQQKDLKADENEKNQISSHRVESTSPLGNRNVLTNDVNKAMEELEALMKEKSDEVNKMEKEIEKTGVSPRVPTSEEQIQMLDHPTHLTDSQTNKADMKTYIVNHDLKVLEEEPVRALALFKRNESLQNNEDDPNTVIDKQNLSVPSEANIEKLLNEGNDFELGEEIKLNYAKGKDNIEQEHVVEKVLEKYLKASDLLKRRLNEMRKSNADPKLIRQSEMQSAGKTRGLNVPINESADEMYNHSADHVTNIKKENAVMHNENINNSISIETLAKEETHLEEKTNTSMPKPKIENNENEFLNKIRAQERELAKEKSMKMIKEVNKEINKIRNADESTDSKSNFDDLFSLSKDDNTENIQHANQTKKGNKTMEFLKEINKELQHANDTNMPFTDQEKKEAEMALDEINKIALNENLQSKTENNDKAKERSLQKITENTSILKNNTSRNFEEEKNLNGNEKEEFEALMNKLNDAMVDSTRFIQSSTSNINQSDADNENTNQLETDKKTSSISISELDDHKDFNDELKWFEDRNEKLRNKTTDQKKSTNKENNTPTKKYKDTEPTKKMVTPGTTKLQVALALMSNKNTTADQQAASAKLEKDIKEHLNDAKEKIKEDAKKKERDLLAPSEQGTGDPLYPPTTGNGRAPLQYNETSYFNNEKHDNNNATLLNNESLVLKNDTLKDLDKTFETTANTLLESPLIKKLKAMENYLHKDSKQNTTVDPYSTFKRSKLHRSKYKKSDVG